MRSGRSRRTCSPSESTTWSSLRRRSRVPGAQRWAAAGGGGAPPYEKGTAGGKGGVGLQKILPRFGCPSFGAHADPAGRPDILAFPWGDKPGKMEGGRRGEATP